MRLRFLTLFRRKRKSESRFIYKIIDKCAFPLYSIDGNFSAFFHAGRR